MKPLLSAVLCAGLAANAFAATETAPIPAVKHGIPTYDFTVRPKLYPHVPRPERDASKPMKVEEAKALAEDLFAAYQNIGALSRFRFHQRTKDEAPMTSDELGWVETELKDEMAIAEKLAAEAETALKTGIERPAAYPDGYVSQLAKLRRMKFGRVKLKTNKPHYEFYRMTEHGAMGDIMLNLYALVDEASDRVDDPKEDAKFVAETRKGLSEDYAELAEARKGMLATAKEAEEKRKDAGATADAARKRAEKAAGAGPKGGRAGKGADAFGVRDSGARITPEEAARQANEVEARAANRKKGRSPAIVPAP